VRLTSSVPNNLPGLGTESIKADLLALLTNILLTT
jgi:hypothetical protein